MKVCATGSCILPLRRTWIEQAYGEEGDHLPGGGGNPSDPIVPGGHAGADSAWRLSSIRDCWASRSCCCAASWRPSGSCSHGWGCRSWPQLHPLGGCCPPFSRWSPSCVRGFWAGVAVTSLQPHGWRPAKTSGIKLRATQDDRIGLTLENGDNFQVHVIEVGVTTIKLVFKTIGELGQTGGM